MRKIWIVPILMAILLSACAPAATVTPAAEPTSVPAATMPAATETAPAATNPPAMPAIETTAAADSSSGLVTYVIVPEESQAGYEVGETFLNQNNRFALAVGVTNTITGEITANPADPSSAQIGTITVDISSFKSDSSRRDQAIRNQWLESSRYPLATFVPTAIEGLPQTYTAGSDAQLKVTGDLTVHETTREVVFDVSVRLDGDTLSGTATTSILLSDFGVGPISILNMLNTEDTAKLTFDFVARPQ